VRAARHDGMSPFRAGLLAVVVLVVACYFAFNGSNPFSSPYELKADFANAANVKPGAAVRIAGVDVGKVTNVEPASKEGTARVTMDILDKGLPIHQDAQIKLRPRIFLEGNMFVDIQPGTPESPTLDSGKTIPASQTSAPVQFSEVLSVLQRDTRTDLQTLLEEFSKGLSGGGAQAFNRSIPYWKPAYLYSSQANEASLGTEPHDLSKLVRAQGKVAHSLAADEEALSDLVTNLNKTFGAFASQSQNLEATVPALDRVLKVGNPALASLNDSLPTLRAFARDALPSAKSSLPTIEKSMPFVTQARRLISKPELRGLVADLRPTIPALAKLNASTIPFLEQSRALSACTSNFLVPFANKPVPDPDFPIPGSNFLHDSQHGLVALAGESRQNDANTPLFRLDQGAGAYSVVQTDQFGRKLVSFGGMITKPEGSRPAVPDHRPVFRPGLPCEKQQLPDLNASEGAAEKIADPNPVASAANKARALAADKDLDRFLKRMRLLNQGKDAPDPLAKYHEQLSALGRREANKLLKVPMETLAKRSGKLYGNGDGKDGKK
jgi:phospholipid/cholesterol/gamma-HCH transport system substrate-binding protein